MINAFYKNSTWQKKVHSFWCSRVQPSEWGFTSPEGSRGNYLLFFPAHHMCYIFLLIRLPTVQKFCYFLFVRNVLMMLLWGKSHKIFLLVFRELLPISFLLAYSTNKPDLWWRYDFLLHFWITVAWYFE